MSAAIDTEIEVDALDRLATELVAGGYEVKLCTPAGRLPFLDVRNPKAAVLSERIYAQAGSFWWSWAERIAGCDQVSTAAGLLARVLRTVDGE